jgi:hypothetical protein
VALAMVGAAAYMYANSTSIERRLAGLVDDAHPAAP